MYVGRMPTASGISVSPRANTVGQVSNRAEAGPCSLFTLRATLTVQRGANKAMAILAVKPPRTRRVVQSTCAVNTSRNIVLSSQGFTKTSILTASCTLTRKVRIVNNTSLVVYKERAASNSATRIKPTVTRRLAVPRTT